MPLLGREVAGRQAGRQTDRQAGRQAARQHGKRGFPRKNVEEDKLAEKIIGLDCGKILPNARAPALLKREAQTPAVERTPERRKGPCARTAKR